MLCREECGSRGTQETAKITTLSVKQSKELLLETQPFWVEWNLHVDLWGWYRLCFLKGTAERKGMWLSKARPCMVCLSRCLWSSATFCAWESSPADRWASWKRSASPPQQGCCAGGDLGGWKTSGWSACAWERPLEPSSCRSPTCLLTW